MYNINITRTIKFLYNAVRHIDGNFDAFNKIHETITGKKNKIMNGLQFVKTNEYADEYLPDYYLEANAMIAKNKRSQIS